MNRPHYILPSVSILVPTYREAAGIAALVQRLAAFREAMQLDMEVLIIDDDSQDGIEAALEPFRFDWLRLIVRQAPNRGLSESIVHGLSYASQDYLVVMDADLSHPPEAIEPMLLALLSGAEMAIGSRYAKGGSTDHAWGFYRWANSRVATALTRPLTSIKDPMSGFFAIKRSTLAAGDSLRPTGYKIGLEIIVKCGLSNIAEIPIHFSDRTVGESKLNLAEQIRFLRHLRRLYLHRLRFWTEFIQFGCVGVSGLCVNLLVVTGCNLAGLPAMASLVCGVLVSFFSNFYFNRLITFRGYSQKSVWYQLAGFASACSLGAVVNVSVARVLYGLYPDLPIQLAVVGGVAAGFAINFMINRYHVFRREVIQPKPEQERE